MLKLLAVAIIVILPLKAEAQQPATPTEQAMAQRIMSEINNNIQCVSSAISLEKQLAAANAKIKELEDKLKKESKK